MNALKGRGAHLSTPNLAAGALFSTQARDRHLNTPERMGRQVAMAMIHINRNRENIGKFHEQEVADGLKSGRFLPTDLAWREPMTTWEPLSTFTDLPAPETSTGTKSDVGGNPSASAEGRILLGECFSKGWECFQKNMGTLMMATFVFLVVNLSLWFVSELAQSVMRVFLKSGGAEEQMLKIVAVGVGLFFSVLTSTITTILSSGFLWMFIKNSRGKCEFADLFAGFSSGMWFQILMAGVATGAIVVGLALLTLAPGIFITEKYGSPVPAVIGTLVFLIPISYLSVGLGFVFPLILDRRIAWQEALRTALSSVHRQWFAAAGLVLVYTLMAISGMLLCCVGMIFTMPLGYSIWAEGYRRLFGDPVKTDDQQN